MTNGSHESEVSAAYAQTERRYWRLADEPRAWWPYAIGLLLGLLALFLIGVFSIARHMQAEVVEQVTQNLVGYDVAEVIADGQRVRISARASETDRHIIEALAASARCPTWAGTLICPRRIDLQLEPPAAAELPSRLHDFVFSRSGANITLSGEVGDVDAKTLLNRAAREQFDAVNDALSVSLARADKRDRQAANAALALLANVERGTATWRNGALSLDALVSASAEDGVRAQFSTLGDPVPQGELTLSVAVSVDVCDEQFNQALSAATIRFDTGSARIDAASNDLLDTLASIAQQCTGTLLIDGHTDNVGNNVSNQALSEARANAVRAALVVRGLPADDLIARGFGESQPVATNESAAGRAKNRRITVRTARSATETRGD
ncbi:MAG: OmpA family protein [Pseudomonadota bacterium]